MKSDSFYKQLDTVKRTINCQNSSVTTAFMGKASAFSNAGLSISYALKNPLEAGKRSVDYVKSLQKEAWIDCFLSLQATNIQFPLSRVWFSEVIAPPEGASRDMPWQVKEKGVLQKSDYRDIIKFGYEWMFEKFYYKVVPKADYEKYHSTESAYINEVYEYSYKNDLPILANCTELLTTPFEMLSGARGMTAFFRDIYDDIGLVKAAVDAMYPGYKEKVSRMLAKTFYDEIKIGSLIGGWRSASNMINEEIFDTLVYEHLFDLGRLFIENNKTPVFHLDENWDREIEKFAVFEPCSIILQTDGNTDLKELRKKLGYNYAVVGDVPSDLLVHGKSKEVEAYVLKLLDDIGPRGLFVCPGCDAPLGTSHKNFLALYKAAASWR